MFTNVHYQLFIINFSKLLQIIIGLLNWYLKKVFFFFFLILRTSDLIHLKDLSLFSFFLFLVCFICVRLYYVRGISFSGKKYRQMTSSPL